MVKNESYHQMPIPPEIGIGGTGTDTFIISPTSYVENRVKAVYIDLPTGVTLNIDFGSGQESFHSNGNEAGSIIFRTGMIFDSDITITVTGTAGTAYAVKMVTETDTLETPTQNVNVENFPTTQMVEVVNQQQYAQAGSSALLLAGLVAGAVYLAMKNKQEGLKFSPLK